MKISKKKIEILFAKNCIELKEFSNISGISTMTVRRIMNGGNAKPITVGKLAKALNVEVTEILE